MLQHHLLLLFAYLSGLKRSTSCFGHVGLKLNPGSCSTLFLSDQVSCKYYLDVQFVFMLCKNPILQFRRLEVIFKSHFCYLLFLTKIRKHGSILKGLTYLLARPGFCVPLRHFRTFYCLFGYRTMKVITDEEILYIKQYCVTTYTVKNKFSTDFYVLGLLQL